MNGDSNVKKAAKKKTSDWTIEGPSKIVRHSVISANKYAANTVQKPEFAVKLAESQFKKIDDSRPYLNKLEDIKASEDYQGLMEKNQKFLQ